MIKTAPVYTIENECQDCYKCVRHCHCKAIRIIDGKASVIAENCVACGECVKVCPSHAKMIRSELSRLRQMLGSEKKLYASIAPSFTAFFPGTTIGQLAAALKKVGFAGVAETAVGAQCVSSQTSADNGFAAGDLQCLSGMRGLHPEISSGIHGQYRAPLFSGHGALPHDQRPVRGGQQGGLFRPLCRQKE